MAKNDRTQRAAKREQLQRALRDPRHDEEAALQAMKQALAQPMQVPASFAETPRYFDRENPPGKPGRKKSLQAKTNKYLDALLNIVRLLNLPRLRRSAGRALDELVKAEALKLADAGIPTDKRVTAIQDALIENGLLGDKDEISSQAIRNSLKRQGLWWRKAGDDALM